MVEEGLGLDVAGAGEIATALKAGVDPALVVLHGNAKSDEEIAMAVEHGLGLVVVDNADDVDRLEADRPGGPRAGRAGARDPRRHGRHARARPDRPRGLEVRAGTRGGRRADPRIEDSPRLRMRGLHVHVGSQILAVEPFAQSVAPVAALGRVPRLRPRRRTGRPLHLRRRARRASAPTSTRWSAPLASTCPPSAELIIEPGRSMVAKRGDDAVPRRRPSSAARDVRRRRRRDGRQPRGGPGRPALRGRRRRPCRQRRRARRSRWSAATARAATC